MQNKKDYRKDNIKMMKSLIKLLSVGSLVAYSHQQKQADDQEGKEKVVYENYSFDFSAHERPLAYTTYGNAIELVSKVKLNPDVENRGGAYVFNEHIEDKEFEIQVEFTMRSDLEKARGFMTLLTQHQMQEEEFLDENSPLGYR